MIRQAHTYLVSAMSGATLIAIAIVAFVLLVSAQVFRDWPVAALGGGNEPHISDSRATAAPAVAATPASTGSEGASQGSTGSPSAGRDAGAGKTKVSGGDLAPAGGPTATTEPAGNGGEPANGGSQGGSNAPSSTPAHAPSNSGSGQGSSSSGGNSGSSAASTPTGKLTETVNSTVNQVDETATGGTLGKTGVTEVTEGIVNGVIGPESAVGKVIDETVGAVGGLLGGKR